MNPCANKTIKKMKDSISDHQFLEQIEMEITQDSLELIRNLRVALADFSTFPRRNPECILPSDHIESDLGIHPLDSMDLVDLAASIETETLRLQPEDYKMIVELNQRDGTVKEFAILILNALCRTTQKQ